ncbi:MAG: hypothetical protein AAFV80_09240 [Bacteroidota bacterium]
MNVIKKLFSGKPSTIFSKAALGENEVCPNCWGRYNYDGKYREFVEDQTKANRTPGATNRKAFIAKFVETHITGIRLKNESERLLCTACNTSYKSVSEKAN